MYDLAILPKLFLSVANGYPNLVKIRSAAIKSSSVLQEKETVLFYKLTETASTPFKACSLFFMVVPQPLHFKFCISTVWSISEFVSKLFLRT